MEPDLVGVTYRIKRWGLNWPSSGCSIWANSLLFSAVHCFRPKWDQLLIEYRKIQGSMLRCTANKYCVTKFRSITHLGVKFCINMFGLAKVCWLGPTLDRTQKVEYDARSLLKLLGQRKRLKNIISDCFS